MYVWQSDIRANSSKGSPFGTTKTYPDDVDTTSYAFKLLQLDAAVAHSVMDKMVSPELTTADGIIKVGQMQVL